MEIAERIIEIISEQLDVPKEECVPTANFREDFKTDSLELVELVMTMENEFDVNIPDTDLAQIRTIEDVMTYVQKKLEEASEVSEAAV